MAGFEVSPEDQGLVDLVIACPVKGWFEAMDRTATTNDVDVPRLG